MSTQKATIKRIKGKKQTDIRIKLKDFLQQWDIVKPDSLKSDYSYNSLVSYCKIPTFILVLKEAESYYFRAVYQTFQNKFK